MKCEIGIELRREVVAKEVQCELREREARSPSSEAEQKAFGECLTDEAPTAGSERGADSHLTAARGGACEHQAGNVGAGDEPECGDGSEEGEKSGALVF